MLSMLVFYDAHGAIVGGIGHLVQYDEDWNAIGLVDFAAHEAQGGKLRDIADTQRLDQPVPFGIAKKVLGREPEPDEFVPLPADHPFRVAHDMIVGAATWPEWLGGVATSFTVELDERKWITALVHKKSGHRRVRSQIEAAIAERRARTPEGEPVDLRSILGGPDRPLLLDAEGRNRPRPAKSQRPALPVVRVGRGSP